MTLAATPQRRLAKTQEKYNIKPAKGTQITTLRLTTLNATFLFCLFLQCRYTQQGDSFLKFSGKCNLVSLLTNIWVKNDFPLNYLVTDFDQIIAQIIYGCIHFVDYRKKGRFICK